MATPETMVRIPDALADRPLPGEALGRAWNVFRRAEISRGQTVAVVGIGFLGALLTQLVARAGAEVIALSRREDSLALARRFGAAEAMPLEDPAAAIAAVLARTAGIGCDRVIEATGLQTPLDIATEITREGGRLLIAGYHQDGERRVNMQLWNRRGLGVVNAHERDPRRHREATRAALDAVAIRAFDPTPLLTHFYPLESLDRAFETARARPSGFFKAVVLMA
jgi:threonine dehydrogenase-like Zn-dependent dehydrogenase